MISQRPNVKPSLCQNCHAYPHQCFCDQIQKFQGNTTVNFIVHHRESHLSSNTAWLGHLVLENSSFALRGLRDQPLKKEDFRFGKNSFILFPSDHAQEMNPEFAARMKEEGDFELFVPDGTWQQAQRIVKRESIFKDVPHLIVNTKRESKYQLRRQSHPGRLCTLEAVIEILKFTEDQKTINSLEWILERHIVANLQRRGLINKAEFDERISKANQLLNC